MYKSLVFGDEFLAQGLHLHLQSFHYSHLSVSMIYLKMHTCNVLGIFVKAAEIF